MDFTSTAAAAWKESLSSYPAALSSLSNPNLPALDAFYRIDLPLTLHRRDPAAFITKPDLHRLMEWKLARGKWRPRLLSFISSLDDDLVESASRKAFAALPDLSKAISELTVLKGVGPATASAVLAAYAPDVAPFMSDEAMVAALGNSREYTLKQYLVFAAKLQSKAKELSAEGDSFTPSDVERALWSSAVSSKLTGAPSADDAKTSAARNPKRKRKP